MHVPCFNLMAILVKNSVRDRSIVVSETLELLSLFQKGKLSSYSFVLISRYGEDKIPLAISCEKYNKNGTQSSKSCTP